MAGVSNLGRWLCEGKKYPAYLFVVFKLADLPVFKFLAKVQCMHYSGLGLDV